MTDLGNKEVLARNLRRIMEEKGVSAKELSKALNFPYTTVLSWLKGDNYPRIDKIDAMSDYLGVLKSDIIEGSEGKPTDYDEISPEKKAFIERVTQMSDAEFERVVQILSLLRGKE